MEWAESHKSLLSLDGELYNHKELTFQEIVSAVKKHSEITLKIRYVVYDRPVADITNDKRWTWLLEQFGAQKEKDCLASVKSPVYISDSTICYGMEQLMKMHDEYFNDF